MQSRRISQNVQINISLPRVWKELLENLARIMAAEETYNLTWHDLIRRAVKEKYELPDESIQAFVTFNLSVQISSDLLPQIQV